MTESTTLIKRVSVPTPDRAEIARYARGRAQDPATESLIEECLAKLPLRSEYSAVYRIMPLCIDNGRVDMTFAAVRSAKLAKHLEGCTRVVLFAVTAGIEIDMYVNKYLHVSPALAHTASAIGSERVEAIADAFCQALASELANDGYICTSRFSAGYGDLSLELQRDIFACLMPEKYLGLCLGASLLMSPSKSVTAIVGVKKNDIS